VEHDTRGGDGDDFLEDAADGQRDDRCALQESEFGGNEAKRETAREKQENDCRRSSLFSGEDVETSDDGTGAFDEECEGEERDEHDGCEEEDGGVRVACGGVAEEEDLCEGPAETGKE